VETLPFDLELFRLDNAIHFRKRRSLGQLAYRMEANSARPIAPGEICSNFLRSLLVWVAISL
jgi:hypothetical protein